MSIQARIDITCDHLNPPIPAGRLYAGMETVCGNRYRDETDRPADRPATIDQTITSARRDGWAVDPATWDARCPRHVVRETIHYTPEQAEAYARGIRAAAARGEDVVS